MTDILTRPVAAENYKIFANKYRPQTFKDMIGQDATVQTLTNAIKHNRLANAYLLTGIRGVGKTTSARIIAKALNCTSELETKPCGICDNCNLISDAKHPDVLEIDAASRTGVDDIRIIIENVHYLPIGAKYKIYIIDEVHMLSRNAFNALLKTLEEPPSFVKFIFATTEIRKIPVTIISRCQRFDLKRIGIKMLAEYLEVICKKENIRIDNSAINLISKLAEGSVRDALSLLDQAVIYSDNNIEKSLIADMAGLADESQITEIVKFCAAGETQEAINLINKLYYEGASIIQILQDMLGVIHLACKIKTITGLDNPPEIDAINFEKITYLADNLELSYLTRAWQLIINGINDVKYATNDLTAGEMLLIKLCFMSNLPSPTKIIRNLTSGHNLNTNRNNLAQPLEVAPTNSTHEYSSNIAKQTVAEARIDQNVFINNYAQLVELFKKNNEILLYNLLHEDVKCIKFSQGRLEINIGESVPKNFITRLNDLLLSWTGKRWTIILTGESSLPSLKEIEKKSELQKKEEFTKHPDVAKILELFPGSYIKDIKPVN